jgi:branched-chain amino acid transport system ATP-binding protein
VLENVLYSFQLRPRSGLLDTFFNTRTYRNNEAYIMEQSLEILNLVGLYKVKDELAKNQPHGYQKMLGVARALAIKPELLLLDEPIAGMNPDEIDNTIAAIKRTSQLGVTIILVEHNMKILEICDRVVVINFGQKIVEGSPQEIKENPEVIKAYFGSGHDTKH